MTNFYYPSYPSLSSQTTTTTAAAAAAAITPPITTAPHATDPSKFDKDLIYKYEIIVRQLFWKLFLRRNNVYRRLTFDF
jgi:hypothetical protein